ncbi:MAG: IS1595 family transposase [Rhizobiales bacterium]|nr:IS1595 family transposase [Hyphomicrobiales bacterium]
MTKRKSKSADFKSLYDLFEAIPDEVAAISYFKNIIWKNGERCPYCGHDKVYAFSDGKAWKCAKCRQRFSIRVGTIFEDSKIPLRKWLAAIWLITSHRKGIASTQIARDLNVTQKTGWFMLHRLRHAARTRSFNRPLRGFVEADEGYFGGKDKNRHKENRRKVKKTLAVGLLERQGELRVFPIKHTGQMIGAIVRNVKEGSRLMTDSAPVLANMGALYDHTAVNHSRGQYGDGADGHTNSIEGVWALIKRQIYGIHHWVSAKHLDRYLAEAVWRYNRRDVKDSNRIADFLTRVDGRLTYASLIAP